MAFLSLQQIKPKEIIPGFHGRFIHSSAMTVAHWEIDAGSTLPTHARPQEMIVNFLAGEFEMTVDGQTRSLRPNDVVVIPGNDPHSAKAITDCCVIDVWHSPRDDYRRVS